MLCPRRGERAQPEWRVKLGPLLGFRSEGGIALGAGSVGSSKAPDSARKERTASRLAPAAASKQAAQASTTLCLWDAIAPALTRYFQKQSAAGSSLVLVRGQGWRGGQASARSTSDRTSPAGSVPRGGRSAARSPCAKNDNFFILRAYALLSSLKHTPARTHTLDRLLRSSEFGRLPRRRQFSPIMHIRRSIVISLALFLCTTRALDQYIEDADRFPGWRGELPSSIQVDVVDSVGYGELGKVSRR